MFPSSGQHHIGQHQQRRPRSQQFGHQKRLSAYNPSSNLKNDTYYKPLLEQYHSQDDLPHTARSQDHLSLELCAPDSSPNATDTFSCALRIDDHRPRGYDFDTEYGELEQDREGNNQDTSDLKWDDSISDSDQARAWLVSASGKIMHVSPTARHPPAVLSEHALLPALPRPNSACHHSLDEHFLPRLSRSTPVTTRYGLNAPLLHLLHLPGHRRNHSCCYDQANASAMVARLHA